MPKFIVTMPAIPFKYFEVEAKDSIGALVALSPTVWTEAQWDETTKRLEESDYFSKDFPKRQRVDICGNPV